MLDLGVAKKVTFNRSVFWCTYNTIKETSEMCRFHSPFLIGIPGFLVLKWAHWRCQGVEISMWGPGNHIPLLRWSDLAFVTKTVPPKNCGWWKGINFQPPNMGVEWGKTHWGEKLLEFVPWKHQISGIQELHLTVSLQNHCQWRNPHECHTARAEKTLWWAGWWARIASREKSRESGRVPLWTRYRVTCTVDGG